VQIVVVIAEDPAAVRRRLATERPAVEVIELEPVGEAADAAVLELPHAASAVARPDRAPDVRGDVAGALGRRRRSG
jgi:hypothetical protein